MLQEDLIKIEDGNFQLPKRWSLEEAMNFQSETLFQSPLSQTENEKPLPELVGQATFSGLVLEKQGLVVESLLQTGSQSIPTISGLVRGTDTGSSSSSCSVSELLTQSQAVLSKEEICKRMDLKERIKRFR